jgi:hypothetical protein
MPPEIGPWKAMAEDIRTSDAPPVKVLIYDFLLRDCLNLSRADARLIEGAYGIPPDRSFELGYRSAPTLSRWRVYQISGRDATDEELQAVTDEKRAAIRALTDEQFEELTREELAGYGLNLPTRTVTSAIFQAVIESELYLRFGPVSGVPGIYSGGGRPLLKLPQAGVLIPCKRGGDVRVLCYPRVDVPRFFWLSSAGLPGGAAAEASIHVADEARAHATRVVVIAAHALAADAVSSAEQAAAVAVNRLSPRRFVFQLRRSLPHLRGCAVMGDCADGRLIRALREAGLRVRIEEGN